MQIKPNSTTRSLRKAEDILRRTFGEAWTGYGGHRSHRVDLPFSVFTNPETPCFSRKFFFHPFEFAFVGTNPTDPAFFLLLSSVSSVVEGFGFEFFLLTF